MTGGDGPGDADAYVWMNAIAEALGWSPVSKRSARGAGHESLLKRRRGVRDDLPKRCDETPVVLEEDLREQVRAFLLSFGRVRSPSQVEGVLQPKEVGGGGWCFFNAFWDQLRPSKVPDVKYLAVLALATMVERYEELAPTVPGVVAGVDGKLMENPEVRDARRFLGRVGVYRDGVNALTPFACVILDKFEGVLSNDLLEVRRYAGDHEMQALLRPCGLQMLVVESTDMLEGHAQRSRVYPGWHGLDVAQTMLVTGALDAVVVRYELGSYKHYQSVCFDSGEPWSLSEDARARVEASHAACDVSQAVLRGEADEARLMMLTALQRAGAAPWRDVL